jgi:hypothetical protein
MPGRAERALVLVGGLQTGHGCRPAPTPLLIGQVGTYPLGSGIGMSS